MLFDDDEDWSRRDFRYLKGTQELTQTTSMYQVLRITRMSLALAWAPRPWYKSWPLSFPTCLFIIRLLKNITQNDLTLSSWLGFRNWIKKIGTAIAHGFCTWTKGHDLLVYGVSVWSHFKTTIFPNCSCDLVMWSKGAGVLMMRTTGDWNCENISEKPPATMT